MISIIIPVYNSAQTIAATLKSVLAQEDVELEVLCVDDGSTDASAALLNEIAAAEPRIKVLTQPNGGAAKARNLALAQAKGDFIAFMDSDDLYPSTRALVALETAARREKTELAAGEIEIREATGEIRRTFGLDEAWLELPSGASVIAAKDYPYDQGFTRFLYARELFEKGLRFPELRRYEDPPFLVRALALARRIALVRVPFYRYCLAPRPEGGRVFPIEVYRDYVRGLTQVLTVAKESGLEAIRKHTIETCFGDEFRAILGNRPYEDADLFALVGALSVAAAEEIPVLKAMRHQAAFGRRIASILSRFGLRNRFLSAEMV